MKVDILRMFGWRSARVVRCRRRGVYSVAVVRRCVDGVGCVVGCDGMFFDGRPGRGVKIVVG